MFFLVFVFVLAFVCFYLKKKNCPATTLQQGCISVDSTDSCYNDSMNCDSS